MSNPINQTPTQQQQQQTAAQMNPSGAPSSTSIHQDQPYGMQQKPGMAPQEQPYGQQAGTTQGFQQTGQPIKPTSASGGHPAKFQGKEDEKEAHRLQEEAARESKLENKNIMHDPNASSTTKVSAAAHAAKDWMTEKKHEKQADHTEKKHGLVDQPR